MKLFRSLILTACLPLILLTSCATIIHGTRQKICISTNPSDAEVWIDHSYVGQSPMIVNLSRKDHHYVRMELEGYQPYEMVINSTLSGWVFGNIIFGGIIGIAVDAVSGGMYRLAPEQVEVQMRANKLVHSNKTEQSYIAIVMEVDPSWEKIGQLTPAN